MVALEKKISFERKNESYHGGARKNFCWKKVKVIIWHGGAGKKISFERKSESYHGGARKKSNFLKKKWKLS